MRYFIFGHYYFRKKGANTFFPVAIADFFLDNGVPNAP